METVDMGFVLVLTKSTPPCRDDAASRMGHSDVET